MMSTYKPKGLACGQDCQGFMSKNVANQAVSVNQAVECRGSYRNFEHFLSVLEMA
jgi:hypothetical protein